MTMFLLQGIMCKYMYIHAYIKTRTLETMRQRRPKSIKTITNQNLNLRKRTHTHGHAHSASQPSHPIKCGAHKKNQECRVITSCFLVRGYRGGGPGRGPLQFPSWPSCADRRVVSGRHRGLAGTHSKNPTHNHDMHRMHVCHGGSHGPDKWW